MCSDCLRIGGRCGACAGQSWPPPARVGDGGHPGGGGGCASTGDCDRVGSSRGKLGRLGAMCEMQGGACSSLVCLWPRTSLGEGAVLSVLQHIEIHVCPATCQLPPLLMLSWSTRGQGMAGGQTVLGGYGEMPCPHAVIQDLWRPREVAAQG